MDRWSLWRWKKNSIKDTRTLLNAALTGELADAEMRKDENFGFLVPLNVNNVDSKILDPKNSWVTGQVIGVDGGLADLKAKN